MKGWKVWGIILAAYAVFFVFTHIMGSPGGPSGGDDYDGSCLSGRFKDDC